MLNDGETCRSRGWPFSRGRRHGLIIHYRDEPEDGEGLEIGSVPPGGVDRRNLEWCQDVQRGQLGGPLWGLLGPP